MRFVFGSCCFLALTGLLFVPAAKAAPAITMPSNLGTFTTGVVQYPLTATGATGTLTWNVSSGTLPPGLAIRTDVPSFFAGGTAAGIIGVATTADNGTPYSFTIQATDSADPTHPQTLAVTMHITSENFMDLNSLPDGISGSTYSYTLTVLNGHSPAVSLANATSLPPGMTLTNLTLGGMPNTPGQYNFQLQIVDGADTIVHGFNIKVAGPHITNSLPLPNATQGQTNYNVTLTAVGGSGSGYTFQISGGNLPNGLNLNSATGQISGTVCNCANANTYNLAVTVTDSTPTSYQQFLAIDVLTPTPALPSLPTQTIDDLTVGIPASIGLTASGGLPPYTWNVTGLPTGMSFRSGAGTSSNINFGNLELWGIPQSTGAGPFEVVVTATDSNNVSVSQTYPIRVSPLTYQQISGNLNGSFILGTAISPAFSLRVLGGTPGYVSLLISGRPPFGTSISGAPTGLSISGTPAENGGFSYQVRVSDSTPGTPNGLTKTLNDQVAPSAIQIFTNSFLGSFMTGGSINFGLSACCDSSNAFVWSVPAANGNMLPNGLNLNSSTGVLTGSTPAGPSSFFVQAADPLNASSYATKFLSINFTPISITTNNVPYGNLMAAYSGLQFAASGAAQNATLTWSGGNGSLPPGMSVSSGGLLGGTPTSTGQYNFTVNVSDGTNSASRSYSISIYPVGQAPPVRITNNPNLGTFTRGDLETDLYANGGNGTYTWTLQSGSLPPGLSIRPDVNSNAASQGSQAGLIGVATTTGNYSFTLQVASANSTATQAFTMLVTPQTLNDSFNLPDAFAGTAYIGAAATPGYTFTVSPVDTMTFTLNSGNNLPPGLSLGTGGTISGTPTNAGNYNFGIEATDGTNIVFRNYNLTVRNIRITAPASAVLPNATQGQTYTQSMTATDAASGTVTFTANGLPNGLTIQSGNVITGTVNSNAGPGLYNVSITASDGPNTTTQSFGLTVVATNAQMMRVNPGSISDAVEGDFYSQGIGLCCGGTGPFTWSATGLPPGLAIRYAGAGTVGAASGTPSSYISPGNAEIYGVPTSDSSANNTVTLTVTDGLNNTTQQVFSLHVSRLNETHGIQNGTIGTAYTQMLRPIGGLPGYTVALTSGALPAGVSLSSTTVNGIATAMLSGMPMESGGFNFALTYTDSTGTPNTLTRFYNFNIANSTNSNLHINTSSPLQPVVTGTTVNNLTLNACCDQSNQYSFSIVGGNLTNSGLSLGSSGAITGTASNAGNYTFLVQVTDPNAGDNPANNTALKQFTLQISSLHITTTSIPFGNLTLQYGGSPSGVALAATGGVNTLTWSLAPGTFLPPGITLSSAGVLAGIPTSMGQYQPGFVVTDGTNTTSISYTLNVYSATGGPQLSIATGSGFGTWSIGYHQFELDASGGTGAYNWSITEGALPPGYALRTDLPSFFTSSASAGIIGVGTTAANYSFTLQVTSGIQTVTKAFTLTIVNLNHADPYLPDGFPGAQYNGSSAGYTMTAVNGAGTLTFSASPSSCAVNFPTNCLPPGLTMASSGAITGMPTTAGVYSFNVSINDGTSIVSRQYNININPMTITTPGVLPNATQGTAYSTGNLASAGGNGTLTWSSSGLPNGFTLNQATGAITASAGFSAGPGRYSVNVTVTDQNQVSASQRFSLDVIGVPAALPQLSVGQIDDATVGVQTWYNLGIQSGGTAPFTYSATGLPPGMIVRQALPTENNNETYGDPQIWGVPSTVGPYTVTLTATDANGVTTSAKFPLNVSPLIHDALPQGTLGIAYNQNLRIVGGTGPYSVTQTVQGQLPDGLVRTALNVTGTPVEDGGFGVTYKYTDSTGTPNTLVRSDFINVGSGSNTFQINNNGNLGTSTAGLTFTATLNANCCQGSLTWSIVGTPPSGISLVTQNSTSGLLTVSSTTAAGTYSFLVQASASSKNNAYRYFTIVVTPLSLTSNNGNTNLPYGNVGTAYPGANGTLTASGATGAVTWTINPGSYLPPGMTLTGNVIGGTPSASGQYSFTLTGTDTANNIFVRNFNIAIYPAGGGPPLFLGTGPNFNFALGTQTIQLSASGGTPPYTYSLTPSASTVPGCRMQNGQPLPTNFQSTVTGGLLCVVTTPGTYPTSVRVTDSASATFDRAINVVVAPFLPTIQSTLPRATQGASYTFTPSAPASVASAITLGAYTYSASPSSCAGNSTNCLPPGLNIDGSTGIISGSPNTPGTYTFNINVGNAAVSYTLGFNTTIVVNPFAITTIASLPQATLGTAYSQTITSTCSASCTWSVASGSLPSNFSLTTNGNNAVLGTGATTPNGTFDGSFTLQVTNGSGQTAQQVFSLIVAPNTITGLSVSTNITTTPVVGNIVAAGLFANGGKPPYTFSIASGSLPPGITLQGSGDQVGGNLAPGTQYLAGRPTTPGTSNFTVQVTDSNSATATKAFTWTISSLSLSYGNLPLSGTSLILNQAYSQPLLVIGGNGTYQGFTVSTPLQTGLALNSSTGIVSGAPTNTGTINDTLTVSDTSATPNTLITGLNVSVTSNGISTVTLGGPAAGTIVPLGSQQTFNISPSGGTGPYTVTPVGTLPAGVLLESGNALGSSFGSGAIGLQTIFPTPGTYTFTLMATDSTGLAGERTYSLIVPAETPILNNTNLPNASVSVPYSFQLYAFSTGTITYSLAPGSAIPQGLGVSAGGLISGTPQAGSAGTYLISVNFSDGTNTATATLTLKVSGLSITTSALLPQAQTNFAYGPSGAGVTLAVSGGSGSTTWSLSGGSLPSGMSLTPATGLISGTPDGQTGTGLSTFAITASNTGGSVTKEFSLYLSLQNPGILTYASYLAALPDVTVGQNFQYNLTPGGGVAPYGWSVAGGSSLPPGLHLVLLSALNGSGSPALTTIAGAPTTAGSYTFNLVLTDSTSATVARTFTLNVSPISITISNPRNAVQGSPYAYQFEATGGTGPYTYTLITNPSNSYGQESLPPGLTFNGATGTISGAPTGTGTYNFLLTVTDSTPGTHLTLTKALSITSANSFGTQITNKSGSLAINSAINQPLTTSSNAAYTWAVQNVSPAPAAPIVNGLPPGINLQNGAFVGNATQAGTYQFVEQATNNANSSDVALRTITVTVTPITMTNPVETGLFAPSLPVATLNQPYSFQFGAAGGTQPYTFTAVPTYPVPPGMTLSSSGLLSGAPTQSGVFTIRPVVTDSSAIPLTDYNFTVNLLVIPAGGKPSLEPRNSVFSSDASVGVPYSVALDRFLLPGVPPYTWTLANGSTLPPGMSIIHGTNGLSDIYAGTPTAAGSYNFTATVTDSASQSLTLPFNGVDISPMNMTPAELPGAIRGSSYSVTLSVTGGTPPYSFQYDQGLAPPPGLSINTNNGLLSGTPTYAGVFPIGIVVTDSANHSLTRDYEFSVDDAAGEVPSISVAPNPVNILFLQGAATTSTPITVNSSSGSLPYNTALYGLTGASLSANNGTTNGSTNINFGLLGAGTYSGYLAASAAGAVNAYDIAPVNITVIAPPPCTYTLTTDTTSSPIGGNSGNIVISAGSGCNWTAAISNLAPWITLTGANSGTGNGTIPYSTAANATGNPRTGTVTITGSTGTLTFTINQFAAGCSFSINPSSVNATAALGGATVNVVASGSACPWTVTGLSAGLTASTSGATGSGSVNITIATNTVANPQTLIATIAGQTFTVNQSSAACNYILSSGAATFAATGGSGSVNVTAPSGCPVTTVLGPSWLNVTSGGSGTATGGAQTLTYTVDPNSTTQPRTGALTIGGQAYAVTEQALACSVSVDTSTLGSPFASGGGSGVIGITTNGSNCPWTAAGNNGFATVTPANGLGNGTVNVTAASNAASTSSRNGSLTISGQTIGFSQGGTTCSFGLRSSSSSIPSTGGFATASVVAPSACTWTAAANASWLHIVNAGTGGSADVSFTADANASANPRIGALTIAGQTFTVTEGGAPCSMTLASGSSGVLASNALSNQAVNFTASAGGCPATVQSFSNWITASGNLAGTAGTLTYSILENDSGTTRSGNIQVGDKVFNVIQTGTGCTYSINSYGLVVNYVGASSSILGSASLGSCSNPPTGSQQPFVSVGTLTGIPALYTLPFTVSPFVSSTTTVRVGNITFGGLTFYVKQSSY